MFCEKKIIRTHSGICVDEHMNNLFVLVGMKWKKNVNKIHVMIFECFFFS